MVAAYKEVYLPDPTVFAVMPFLLTAGETFSGWPWAWWNETKQNSQNGSWTRMPQWEATHDLRCSLGVGGGCDAREEAM